jgi:amino acid transporter
MTDYDATAHITEEMKNPAVKAPVAILSALGTTYVLGFVLNIVLAIDMGPDWGTLLYTPTGLPMAQLFYNVLGKRGGVAFMCLSAAICNFTGASCLQAQARTLFALSRGCLFLKNVMITVDEMLPFSKYMHKIWKRTRTPVISVWVNVLFCALLGLIDLGSFTAITAIFNVNHILNTFLTCRSRQFVSTGAAVFRSFAKYQHLILG